MDRRLELHTLLKETSETENVYFQPPASLKLKYPCVIYQRENTHILHADNQLYKNRTRYQVTYIDRNPDNQIRYKLEELPLCRYNRFYAAQNLNHDVFTIYF